MRGEIVNQEESLEDKDYEAGYVDAESSSDSEEETNRAESDSEDSSTREGDQSIKFSTNDSEEVNKYTAQPVEIAPGTHSYVTKNPWILGNCLCFGYKNGIPRFTIGPHWPFYLCLNFFALGLSSLFLTYVISRVTYTGTVLGIIIVLIYFVSYTLTAILNPGIPPRNLSQYDPNYLDSIRTINKKFCKICNVVKEGRNVEHCEDCDLCVEDLDHHCPWTGKCIAGRNKIYFNIFVSSVMVLLIYMMVTSIICWHIVTYDERKSHSSSRVNK